MGRWRISRWRSSRRISRWAVIARQKTKSTHTLMNALDSGACLSKLSSRGKAIYPTLQISVHSKTWRQRAATGLKKARFVCKKLCLNKRTSWIRNEKRRIKCMWLSWVRKKNITSLLRNWKLPRAKLKNIRNSKRKSSASRRWFRTKTSRLKCFSKNWNKTNRRHRKATKSRSRMLTWSPGSALWSQVCNRKTRRLLN